MHDLDRTQSEFEPEEGLETGDFELEPGELGMSMESPFSESEEIDLASQFLEISSDAELDQFLGRLVSRAAKGVGRFISSPTGRALVSIAKPFIRKALPIVGGALGTAIGGPAGGLIGGKLASMAGNVFGLEIEGLTPEDQDFEIARRYVRLAGSAAQKASAMSPGIQPNVAARTAFIEAAKIHAPGLVKTAATPQYSATGCQKRSGRWYRRGNKIVLYGTY